MVTLELHVRHDLGDEDVLRLTRWAWQKCVGALWGGRRRVGVHASLSALLLGGEREADEGPEVSVGVVRE